MTDTPNSSTPSMPPFAQKVLKKLKRFQECAEDGQGVDIGRHWLDLLVQLALLNRVQRSPALWEITQQGEDLLEPPAEPANCAKSQVAGQRERFQKWVLSIEHPVLGWLDGHWLKRGDDREGYASEYVQGLWVAFKAFAGEPAEQQDEPVYFVRGHGAESWEQMSGEGLELCRCQPDEYEIVELYRRSAAQAVKLDENAEFERWRKEQIASLARMGYPDAARAFRELGSVQWAGWQARACLDAVAKLNGIEP